MARGLLSTKVTRPSDPSLEAGANSVGAAAATEVQDLIAGMNFHRFDQCAGTVVEPAISKGAGPRQEHQRRAIGPLGVESNFMAAARLVALPLDPVDAALAGLGSMTSTEDFLELRRKKLVVGVIGHHEKRAARPQDVECLLDHVDFQAAFAAARGWENGCLKI